jgi:regulator of PEP synthase PpsR (kinase-PPPase family)
MKIPAKIVILSGGTGRTADQVLNAALAQFENPQVEIVRKRNIRGVNEARQIIQQAADDGAIVCHTLVEPDIHEAVHRHLLQLNVPSVDLLGPVVRLLADHLGEVPRGQAGLLYELCKEQFDRSDAVDFTFAHDDGQRVHDLELADVVLVGVSRASKSVTCFYLAARGIRAANVPLILNCPLPTELESLDPRRVIGITMNLARLRSVRQTRLEHLSKQRPIGGYAEQQDIAAEVRYAAEIMSRHKWRYVDVSYKATEEVASEIIQMLPDDRSPTSDPSTW